jgi:hypothetical protein
MTSKITEARRALFEAFVAKTYGYASREEGHDNGVFELNELGQYIYISVGGYWRIWNAALDAVEIELPGDPNEEFCDRRSAVEACRAAIESTNLGLRVK